VDVGDCEASSGETSNGVGTRSMARHVAASAVTTDEVPGGVVLGIGAMCS